MTTLSKQSRLTKMLWQFGLFILFIIFLWFFFRHLERRNLYFPTREIEGTPNDIGLKYEDVYFDTEDGVRLNGWFIPANNAKGTILFCHGNGGNISHRFDSIAIFNKLGCEIFIFDYRGYGRSAGRPNEQGTYLDALAAYEYLTKQKNRKSNRIVLFGRSLGGAIAIDLATKVEASALIVESSFTSTVNIAREIYPFLPVKWIVTMKYDSISKIDSIKIPKLIIHSRDDDLIRFHHGRELFEKAREPKKFLELRGSHNEGFLLMEEEYTKKIGEFLEKYL